MKRFVLPVLLTGMLSVAVGAQTVGPRAPIPKGTIRESYPGEAVRKGQEGRVSYRLTVDDKGDVLSCVVTASSGHELLDEHACHTMRRTRFEPALDAGGAPTTGTYESTATYDLH